MEGEWIWLITLHRAPLKFSVKPFSSGSPLRCQQSEPSLLHIRCIEGISQSRLKYVWHSISFSKNIHLQQSTKLRFAEGLIYQEFCLHETENEVNIKANSNKGLRLAFQESEPYCMALQNQMVPGSFRYFPSCLRLRTGACWGLTRMSGLAYLWGQLVSMRVFMTSREDNDWAPGTDCHPQS